MAEDEDIEQDSEEYRKWRSGDDKDKYASSRTPTETGSKSGSYTIPESESDEYALPEEESTDKSWLDSGVNWPMIIAAVVIFTIVASAIFAFAISSGDSGSNPSEWPETEGTIIKQTNSKMFIDGEFCEDENDDGWEDDWECWKEFVFAIDLTTQYSVDQKTYQTTEYVEFWEEHGVDELKEDGGENEERLFENFTDYWNEEAANGSISLNSTVDVIYNPENPKEAYSEFSQELPGDPMGFVGYFFMCCGGFLCIPIIIGGIIMSWAQRATGMGGYSNRRGWGPFGGGYFGNNRHHRGGSKRRRTPTRRSSGGGGRSGSGSRGGGGRRR